MTDLRFHDRTGPHSLAKIALASECILADASQGDVMMDDVAPLDAAGGNDLSFLDNPKYKDKFRTTKAGAVIVSKDMAASAPKGCIVLVSDNPYRSYALAAAHFYPWPAGGQVSERAHIEAGAQIGEGCIIEAGAYIGANVVIGKGCWIGSNASITHAVLGQKVRVHAGARIGQDGFGFSLSPKGYAPVPQLGRVLIEDFVSIGANTCIDRGAGPDTVIGMGSVLDNMVQIAHNVKLGKGCVLAAQVGISGSTTLGDYVVMGGQSGIAGHLTIGSGVRIAAKSGVTKDVPAGEEWVGFPAAPRRAYWREQATIKKLLSKGNSQG